jgi:hypothetical protein
METLFDICMRGVRRVCVDQAILSEPQYHRLVECIRYLATLPALDPPTMKRILLENKLNAEYDPFEDPTRLRFFVYFGDDDDPELSRHLHDFDLAKKEYEAQESTAPRPAAVRGRRDTPVDC